DIATAAASQPLWKWLWIFEIENGPLFYATELAGRFLTSIEASARIAPALIGTATIPMAWLAGRSISSYPATAYVAPLLIAISPLHIYYSREARPYALIVLVTVSMLAAMLGQARIQVILGIFVAALYTAATTAPLMLSVAVAGALRRTTW